MGFNVSSPVISQHFAYLGGSLPISRRTALSVAYIHGFENRSGTDQSPAGPIPGSTVASEVSLDALAMGITVQYEHGNSRVRHLRCGWMVATRPILFRLS